MPTPTGALPQLKDELRARFRAARKAHVAALPASTRALILMRPPAPVVRLVEADSGRKPCVGLYAPCGDEAPTLGYARWFHENGMTVALPWFANREAPMEFRAWTDPWDEDALSPGPWRAPQPPADTVAVTPDVVFVPLVAFTADGARLGQGGGHYDRWLAAHPDVTAIGLGWDCQLAEGLPRESHDVPLRAVVTPTRIHGLA